MHICFLVGSVAISGGTYVIFQHASFLRRQGHRVTLAVQEPFTPASLAWHDEANQLECVPFEDACNTRYDVVIATWWKTALEMGAFVADHYAYFVQSIESRFYPRHEKPLRDLVDKTYTLPLCYSTEATWIQRHLREHNGWEATLVRNGIRKDLYDTKGPVIYPRQRCQQPRILVEGHFGVPFKNTVPAIQIAKQASAKDIWLLTGSDIRWAPGVTRVFSRVPVIKTPEIYRSCDVLVKLSTIEGMFGPPLEMFHCGGTAVVFDVSGHDEYIVADVNALVVKTGDIAAAVDAVRRLLASRPLLEQLQQGAMETAVTWPCWEQSSNEFQRWIEDRVVSEQTDIDAVRDLIANIWAEYAAAERARLSRSPLVGVGYRVSALASRLPASARRIIREGRIAWQLLGSSVVVQ